MKTTQQCPKCGNRAIIRVDGEARVHGNHIMVGMSILSAVKVNRYVCCSCGFSEEWIDPEDLNCLKSSRKATHL